MSKAKTHTRSMINISETWACGRVTSVLLKRDLSTCPSAAFVLQRPPGALGCQPALQAEVELTVLPQPSSVLGLDWSKVNSSQGPSLSAEESALRSRLHWSAPLKCLQCFETVAIPWSGSWKRGCPAHYAAARSDRSTACIVWVNYFSQIFTW